MQQLIQIASSLGTGIIMGIVFTLLKLPLPAPTAWAGIAGIIGVFLGSLIITYFTKK